MLRLRRLPEMGTDIQVGPTGGTLLPLTPVGAPVPGRTRSAGGAADAASRWDVRVKHSCLARSPSRPQRAHPHLLGVRRVVVVSTSTGRGAGWASRRRSRESSFSSRASTRSSVPPDTPPPPPPARGRGGAHLWFFPRPLGQLQLRGSMLPVWLDVLAPVDPEVEAATLRRIASALAASA